MLVALTALMLSTTWLMPAFPGMAREISAATAGVASAFRVDGFGETGCADKLSSDVAAFTTYEEIYNNTDEWTNQVCAVFGGLKSKFSRRVVRHRGLDFDDHNDDDAALAQKTRLLASVTRTSSSRWYTLAKVLDGRGAVDEIFVRLAPRADGSNISKRTPTEQIRVREPSAGRSTSREHRHTIDPPLNLFFENMTSPRFSFIDAEQRAGDSPETDTAFEARCGVCKPRAKENAQRDPHPNTASARSRPLWSSVTLHMMIGARARSLQCT